MVLLSKQHVSALKPSRPTAALTAPYSFDLGGVFFSAGSGFLGSTRGVSLRGSSVCGSGITCSLCGWTSRSGRFGGRSGAAGSLPSAPSSPVPRSGSVRASFGGVVAGFPNSSGPERGLTSLAFSGLRSIFIANLRRLLSPTCAVLEAARPSPARSLFRRRP